jgi:predicted Zn-dependent peptidase
MSDIFLNSIFDEKDVENERPVILQEIGMSLETPDDHIHQLHGENFWGADPLGRSILGTPENVSAFNADIIKEYFVSRYQPQRIIISAAGNVLHDGLVDMLAPAFSAIAPRQARTNPRPVPQTYFRVKACRKELEQTHICLSTAGLSATDPRRFAFSLLNIILGGNMSSRLFQEIRERRGLAYAVYAFSVSYSDTGMMGAYAGVEPKNTYQTVALMAEQLQRLRLEAVSETELHDAKQFTRGNLLLSVESSENQMARLVKNEINWGTHVSMQSVIDKIDAVSAADIQALADNLFKPGSLSLTLLGPGDPDLDRFQTLLAL